MVCILNYPHLSLQMKFVPPEGTKMYPTGKNFLFCPVGRFYIYFFSLFDIRLYSNGNKPVLLRNNSANRLEVEYPTV